MSIDIIDLRAFYARPLGRLVRQFVGQRLQALWSAHAGQMRGRRLLGLGFATPFLGAFEADAERVVAAMPAGQGVTRWPEAAPGRVVLTDEQALPFPDRTFDRILLVHCIEAAPALRPLMRECWRVLADGGRLMVVVPNRRSLWSRIEASPFAQGQPYSMGQITRVLRDNMFVPCETATALFVPPVGWRLFAGFAVTLENLGVRWFPTFGGALVVEAEKQLYATPFTRAPAGGARLPVKAAVKTSSGLSRSSE